MAPVADFSALPLAGAAPLAVQFTDLSTGMAAPLTWANLGMTATQDSWKVASSADGTRLYAVDFSMSSNGALWVSSDSGATWAEVYPDGTANHRQMVVACDSTGLIVVAAVSRWAGTCLVFRSTNGGANWTDITMPGAPGAFKMWRSIAVSGDGQAILCAYMSSATATEKTFLSTDAGANWTADPLPETNAYNHYYSCAISDDGTRMAMCRCWDSNGADQGTAVLLSDNSGATWTQVGAGFIPVAYQFAHMHVSMSSSGQYILVANTYGGAYLSLDYGATWTTIAPPAGAGGQWSSTAITPSGSTLFLGGSNNAQEALSRSTNLGTSWDNETVPVIALQKVRWSLSAAIDSTGTLILVGTDANSTPGKQVFLTAPAPNGPSWDWDYGDGTAHGVTQSPLHTYAGGGTYTVALIATNIGVSDTETKVDYVTVTAPAGAAAGGGRSRSNISVGAGL